jgi:hypothetical protein
MKELLVKYFRGHPLNISEVIAILTEYMSKIGKYNQNIIDFVSNPMNPFSQETIQWALSKAATSLASDYNITRLFSKEGALIMVY